MKARISIECFSAAGSRKTVFSLELFVNGYMSQQLVFSWSDLLLCKITVLMGSVVAGAGVNPADQRWDFWSLLPFCSQLLG